MTDSSNAADGQAGNQAEDGQAGDGHPERVKKNCSRRCALCPDREHRELQGDPKYYAAA
jgi:hypothetical protein